MTRSMKKKQETTINIFEKMEIQIAHDENHRQCRDLVPCRVHFDCKTSEHSLKPTTVDCTYATVFLQHEASNSRV